MKKVTLALAMFVAFAGTAQAALTADPALSATATAIAGVPVTVMTESDPAAWIVPTGISGDGSSGYVTFATRTIALGPYVTAGLAEIQNGQVNGDAYKAAFSVLILTHEAYHLKLNSSDEGTVNACALAAVPGVLATYFGVAPTVTQTSVTRVRVRVKMRGRWVVRYRTVTRTSTVPNVTYVALVGDAEAAYASAPPPYSTGVCS